MSYILSLLGQFERRSLVEFAVFALITAILELASIWVLRSVLLLLFVWGDGGGLPALPGILTSIELDSEEALIGILAAAFAFILLKSIVLVFLWRFILSRLGVEQCRFAVRLFERYLRMPYMRHIDGSRMTLQQNLNIALTHVFIFAILPLMQIAIEVIVGVTIFLYLLSVSMAVALVLVLWIVVVAVFFRAALDETSRNAGVAQRESVNRMLRVTQDALSDVKSIKILGREKFFSRLFGDAAEVYTRAWTHARFFQQIPRFTLEPMLIGALVTFGIVLSLLDVDRQTLFLNLSVFTAAAMRLLPAANRIINQSHTLSFYDPDLREVWADVVRTPENLEERPEGRLPPPFAENIRMEDVSVSYRDGEMILKNVWLDIRKGDKILLTGKTGAGKTTLLNVLLGFVSPESGRILFDGHEEQPLTRFRRSATAFVPQDICLLDDSIAANIAFGEDKDKIDVPMMWTCLQRVHFDTYVRNLPDGLQTRIGENGVRLSGGERQRLALARALYQKPKFLALDEATSQLDMKTEAAVLDGLFASDPDLTVVMATHRLSSVEYFARRYRVEDGCLIAME